MGPLVKFEFKVDTGEILLKQIRDPSLSPDGKRLLFSALDRLYTLDLPNGTPKRLTSDTVHEQNPVWSPDGKWVAYITWGNAGGYVQRVKSTGGKAERLSADPAFYQGPAWSPDGQRIVVIRGPRQARVNEAFGPGYELDWLPAAGGALTRVSPIRPGGASAFLQRSEPDLHLRS